MAHGGKRAGAGRPKQAMEMERIRVPLSMVSEIKQYMAMLGSRRIPRQEFATFVTTAGGTRIPLYSSKVQAGNPSSAEDHVEEYVDLSAHLVNNPEDTFLVRATGESMIDAGIHEGDLLVVDRSLPATHGKIVVAAVDGQVTVKYLMMRDNKPFLVPANKDFQDVPVGEGSEVVIWGVLTSSIKTHG